LKSPLIGLLIFLVYSPIVLAQNLKNELEARRVKIAPKIDGILDDDAWEFTGKGETYHQLFPDNGAPSTHESEVQLVYTDYGIYVGAKMYDPEPDKIPKELGIRDDGNKNTDEFGIMFDTYNTGQNAFAFIVTAAGVQRDVSLSPRDEDDSWDAVWKSEVKINDEGWFVEMEIPYSALRFPNKDKHIWGFNIMRKYQRNKEEAFWNFVDNSIQGFVNQAGTLKGLENIEPPVRLFFTPFVANSVTYDGSVGKAANSFNAGMDLKYGINESFTLDMSLIPDFSQVRSDDQVLNLSPFEVRFDENRPFFTESTELFNKAGLFFSRRIGKSFGSASDHLLDNEEVVERPREANLLNSTKISGRTKKGLGIGFLNAITKKTTAILENTETLERREITVDPLTNFNVFVLDQALKNNSNIGIINTNVTRTNGGDNANVTAADIRLNDKTNTYRLNGFAALSQKMTNTGKKNYKNNVGYRYMISAGKVSGKFQYRAARNVISDSYDINDLGFLTRGNRVSHWSNVSYNIFKPFWKMNRLNARLSTRYNTQYKTGEFTDWGFEGNINTQLKNFWNIGFFSEVNPQTSFDYFEPRNDGYFVRKSSSHAMNIWMVSDSRKAFRMGFFRGRWIRKDWGAIENWFGIFPRFRVSNKLTFDYELNRFKLSDDRGYVTELLDVNDELESIIFGIRNVTTVNNEIGAQYTFNRNMGINLRVRHNWSRVTYSEFRELDIDGNLYPTSYTGLDENGLPEHNTNFNAFNVDMVFSWQIGPGSFINIIWKDAILKQNDDVRPDFFRNIGNTLASDQVNSFSFKIIYFIDYLNLKQRF